MNVEIEGEEIEATRLWAMIDKGGGQACDIRGVLRVLHDAGYWIYHKEHIQEMWSKGVAAGKKLNRYANEDFERAMAQRRIDEALGQIKTGDGLEALGR